MLKRVTVILVLRVTPLPGQMPREHFSYMLTGTLVLDTGPDLTSSNF